MSNQEQQQEQQLVFTGHIIPVRKQRKQVKRPSVMVTYPPKLLKQDEKILDNTLIMGCLIEINGRSSAVPRNGAKVHFRGWNSWKVYELIQYYPVTRQWLSVLIYTYKADKAVI